MNVDKPPPPVQEEEKEKEKYCAEEYDWGVVFVHEMRATVGGVLVVVLVVHPRRHQGYNKRIRKTTEAEITNCLSS